MVAQKKKHTPTAPPPDARFPDLTNLPPDAVVEVLRERGEAMRAQIHHALQRMREIAHAAERRASIVQPANAAWRAGYEQGVKDAVEKLQADLSPTPREKWQAETGQGAVDAELIRSTADRGGYERGAIDFLRVYRAKDFTTLDAALEKWSPAIERFDAMEKARAEAQAISGTAPTTMQAKASRTRQLNRMARDQAQAAEFAALIRGGETTVTAAKKMGIGIVRAKRLRSVAVSLKWIRVRQRKAGDPIP
jgi:hypothetical protein